MRWLSVLLAGLAAFIAAYFAVILAAPGFIMDRVMDAMAERGVPLHDFVLSPAITPQTQTVVRPAPDLAYSICRFHFGAGVSELEIAAGAYDGMASVAFFDAGTNNFATRRVPAGGTLSLRLQGPGGPGAASHAGETIESPTERGLILIRRLAPGPDAYARVVQAAGGDRCGPLAAPDTPS